MPVTINGSGGFTANDGSAAAPSIAGTDSNTGVFFPAADTVAIATGGSERMRVDSSGNVGINTTSPGTFGKFALQVDGTTTPTNATNVGPSSISLYAAANGSSTNSTVGIFGWQASQPGIGSGIGFSRENSSDWGSQIRFYTHPTTTSNISDLTERARIDSSGNLLVGTTSQVAQGKINVVYSNNSHQGLCFNENSGSGLTRDAVRFQTSGTQVGSISVSTTATAYNTSSDYRLKEDIQPMTGALARVTQLKPVTYKWKSSGEAAEGFIAHELQAVVPDCVTGEKDAVDAEGNPIYQGIDTSFLVATLTAAIQEQQALIESLTARIAALETA